MTALHSMFTIIYQKLVQRLEYLESIAHPKCGIEEFEGYEQINGRIKDLENANRKKRK